MKTTTHNRNQKTTRQLRYQQARQHRLQKELDRFEIHQLEQIKKNISQSCQAKHLLEQIIDDASTILETCDRMKLHNDALAQFIHQELTRRRVLDLNTLHTLTLHATATLRLQAQQILQLAQQHHRLQQQDIDANQVTQDLYTAKLRNRTANPQNPQP